MLHGCCEIVYSLSAFVSLPPVQQYAGATRRTDCVSGLRGVQGVAEGEREAAGGLISLFQPVGTQRSEAVFMMGV